MGALENWVWGCNPEAMRILVLIRVFLTHVYGSQSFFPLLKLY